MDKYYYKKVFKAIKEGSFWRKTRDKWKEKYHLHYICNKSAEALFYQSATYDKLYREYKDIIDEEIIVADSEKSNKVWICWFQGFDKAPELVKACVQSIREQLSAKEIILLDDSNIEEYIEIPEYIKKKRAKGIITPAHYSDIVRVSILCKWGGIWIDSTVFCTGNRIFKIIEDMPLFVFSQNDLLRKDIAPIVASSWFISAFSNQKILLLTKKLLFEYWRREKYLREYYLFHLFFAMSSRRYEEDWNKIPNFNNHNPHMLQFELGDNYDENRWEQLKYFSDVHKLNNHYNYSDDDTFYGYLLKYSKGK